MKIISSKAILHIAGIAVLIIAVVAYVPNCAYSQEVTTKNELEKVYNKFIESLYSKNINDISAALFWDFSNQDYARDRDFLKKNLTLSCNYLQLIHPKLSNVTYINHQIIKDGSIANYYYAWKPPPRQTLGQFMSNITPGRPDYEGPVVNYWRFIKADNQWKLDFEGSLFEYGIYEQPLLLEENDDFFKAAREVIKSQYWQEDGNSLITYSFISIFRIILPLIIIIILAYLARKYYKKERRFECIGNKVIIRTSRTASVIKCLIMMVILIGFPWILLLGMPLNIQELKALDKGLVQFTGLNVGFYIIACLPLLMLPSLIKNLRIVFVGRTVTFDGTTKKVFKNDKELVHFSQIKNFNFKNMEGLDIYLDCILTTGKKIKFGKIGSYTKLKAYKTDILNVVQFSEKTIDEIPHQSDEFGKVFAVAHYFILVISLLMIIGGLYAFFSSVLLNIIGTTTTGTVIDQKVEKTEKWVESGRVGRSKRKVRTTSTTVIYTVEYQDAEGNVHTFETSALEDGGSLEVVYLKFWPAYAKVKSFSGEWGPVVVLLFFGGLIFCISQMFNEKFFKRRERKRKQKVEK